ncbi:MAG: pyrroline-5-carboxylate reductase [Chlamydiales bacterium]|nr:pyrroline-5-carboxylate reductase [Chlamydiales bacterium]
MRITIIGCGNMGGGLAGRLSQTNQLFLYDRGMEKAKDLAHKGYGIACKNITEALHSSETIILAVKPQDLQQAAALIKEGLQENQMIISLLAGTSIKTLQQYFQAIRMVRMMPNLPLLYGEGVIGLSSDEQTKKEDKDQLTKTFELLGKVYWLSEEKIDALTALASSGPAFFFAMVEAMIDAGIAMGFTPHDAQGMIYQMLQGSLTLLEKTCKHPGELKWQVTSPQGTTIAGLKRLEELALRGSIINTFLASYDRAKELSSNR